MGAITDHRSAMGAKLELGARNSGVLLHHMVTTDNHNELCILKSYKKGFGRFSL